MAWHPFRNVPLKILALALSSALWLTIARDQEAERAMRVPLEFRNIPEGLEIIGESPADVDVRVRGASGVLSRLASGDIVAVLDMRQARPGQRILQVRTDEVRVPFGIEVSQVSPPTITMQFEQSGSRVVPVAPALDGEPAIGFVAGEAIVSPATVEVIGPQSRLKALREATTEPVSLANARADVRDTVTVGVADATLRLRGPRTALVVVPVRPAPIERSVQQVPVVVRNLAEGLRAVAEPTQVTVILRGERSAIGAITVDRLEAWVDASVLSPGRYVLPVRFDAGQNYGMARAEPASVNVRIR